jgi:hypothetical protein
MKDFWKILKRIANPNLIPIILIPLTFACIWIYKNHNRHLGEDSYIKLIKSEKFRELESFLSTTNTLQNIAILPDSNYIVINGTIINRNSKTFGEEPFLGFYINYYTEGSKNKYISIDSLLLSTSCFLNTTELNNLISSMNFFKIIDIRITNDSCNKIIYRWAVSAMWGEEGIIKSDCKPNYPDIEGSIKEILDGYYLFNK